MSVPAWFERLKAEWPAEWVYRDGWPGRDDDGWAWHDWCRDPRDAFKHLWRSIYGTGTERGDYGWDANPLVWVCAFNVVTP